MYGYSPAITVLDFNFVGNASALIKKGANESLIDMNDFRDIFIKVIEQHKEDQADPELGESSKRTYI